MNEDGYDKKIVSTFDNPFYDREFNVEEIKKMKYNKYKVPIGKTNKGQVYEINLQEACRIIFFAETRTGKTFSMRSMMDRLYRSGYPIVILPDTKDEYKSSLLPVQNEFQNNMLPGEYPEGLKMKIYRPKFFKGELPDKNEWITIDLCDLSKADFKTLMSYEKLPAVQQKDILIIYDKIEKGEFKTIEDIIEYQKKNKEIGKAIINYMIPLQNSNLLSSRYVQNIINDLVEGYIPVLNFRGFESLGEGGDENCQVMIAIWIREIVEARRQGKIPPLFILMDELARWCPASGDPSSKKEIMQSVDLHAGEGVNYIFATQRVGSIPEDIISQCKYQLIPKSGDDDLWSNILRRNMIIRDTHTDFSRVQKMRQQMYRWFWLIVNSKEKKFNFIRFLSPLSKHQKTRN